MTKTNNNDPFDLGSEPTYDEFDPFATDEGTPDSVPKSNTAQKSKPSTGKVSDNAEQNVTEKLPVFEYASATEDIDDISKTFDELRIAKSEDFPELEDGKRVTWTIEYGKITKSVADPKGVTIGKMKAAIETSKEFQDALNKAKDKNPVCKIKPRVTAQSKGTVGAYKGVFTNMDEVNAAAKVISIVPAKDGKVYEIRNTKIGRFITPVAGCELLSDVQAGFAPALPPIPMDFMMKIVSFFRCYMDNGKEQEVLVNVYWDKQNQEFVTDVPEQTVTKASVESTENLDFADERYIHYMDIHSHNSMKAFFSAVDDKDEQATRLYSVIGRLDKYFPNVKTRISNGGKFWEINPGEVFELIGKPFPNEWKDRVKPNEVCA